MIKKSKKDQSGESDFGAEDFDDAVFDEASEDFAEYDDVAGEEADFSEENFGEDWEEEESQTSTKKTTSLKNSKSGLSFNAKVILGAVILGGGVLAFNVMNKTAKLESTKTSFFQSVLDIGGIMDGTLYGDKKDDEAAGQEELNANSDGGFLNNPDAVLNQNTPPQPVPMAPTDTAPVATDMLTPMPSVEQGPEGAMPRGPDDIAQVVPPAPLPEPAPIPEMATEPVETGTAMNVLQQAIDDRVNQAAQPEIQQPTSPPALDPVEALPEKKESPALEPEPKLEPVAAQLEEKQPDVQTPALKSFEIKLDEVLARLGKIETDVAAASTRAEEKDKSLEVSLETLKTEISELRARPTQVVKDTERAKETVVEKQAEKPVQPKAVKKAKAAKPKPVKTWELRAAQPGRAWVSSGDDARDVKAVTVGDTLPGIGKITGINFVNGSWIVQGTNAQIRQ